MKLVKLLILVVPLLVNGQKSKEKALENITTIASSLTSEAYKEASVKSDSLLVLFPLDSLVLRNRISLYHKYVKKSKCQAYQFPKVNNLCENALSFYQKTVKKINYPRLYVAIGMVYYNWAKYGQKSTQKQAVEAFNYALKNADLADFEKRKINTYIRRLQ